MAAYPGCACPPGVNMDSGIDALSGCCRQKKLMVPSFSDVEAPALFPCPWTLSDGAITATDWCGMWIPAHCRDPGTPGAPLDQVPSSVSPNNHR